ncbi:MAG: hypothetical protein H6712_16360 [Myxococcales bacterium]|nr:hypothetical protein [Myxococcales bacterium]MCB9715443.1 hypothetical protein [Myxococcales bacterium]
MVRGRSCVLAGCLAAASALLGCQDEPPAVEPRSCEDESSLEIFEKRIAPLLADDSRSACNECHLAGIDLGLYSPDGDECRTMACMVDAGIVDLDAPDQSKVLDWILRADPSSPLITENVLQQEHDGMLEWIEYHSSCGAFVCPQIADPCGTASTVGSCEVPESGHDLPARGFEDPGDCSDLTVEQAFGELVYSWRGRCYPCHWDSKPDSRPDAPLWIVDAECNSGSLATMRNVLEQGLVDVAAPDQSLLLLKPLAEDAGGVEHGGDAKFFDTTDGAYQDFKAWVELYARCNPG